MRWRMLTRMVLATAVPRVAVTGGRQAVALTLEEMAVNELVARALADHPEMRWTSRPPPRAGCARRACDVIAEQRRYIDVEMGYTETLKQIHDAAVDMQRAIGIEER